MAAVWRHLFDKPNEPHDQTEWLFLHEQGYYPQVVTRVLTKHIPRWTENDIAATYQRGKGMVDGREVDGHYYLIPCSLDEETRERIIRQSAMLQRRLLAEHLDKDSLLSLLKEYFPAYEDEDFEIETNGKYHYYKSVAELEPDVVEDKKWHVAAQKVIKSPHVSEDKRNEVQKMVDLRLSRKETEKRAAQELDEYIAQEIAKGER